MTLNKSQAISRVESFPSAAQCTVFFDGACPVRSLEIAAYRLLKGGDAFKWVDASRCDASVLIADLDQVSAMRRLHVRRSDGTLVSGAVAFVEIWKQLPAFAWLARICANRTAVGEVFENLQTLCDDGVRFRAFDVCDKTDATSVVFVGGIVQSLGTGRLRHGLPHG